MAHSAKEQIHPYLHYYTVFQLEGPILIDLQSLSFFLTRPPVLTLSSFLQKPSCMTARLLSSPSWRLFRPLSRPAVWCWADCALIIIMVQEKSFQVTSPSCSDMWVALIWAVNRFWSASSTIILLTEAVISKNLDADRQHIMHTDAHQITLSDWSQAARLSLSSLAAFQTVLNLPDNHVMT